MPDIVRIRAGLATPIERVKVGYVVPGGSGGAALPIGSAGQFISYDSNGGPVAVDVTPGSFDDTDLKQQIADLANEIETGAAMRWSSNNW